ncbi:hypothetical protein BZA77DRAFT_116623 [Pyronema omphalodes]|nr:hypothetical protein BZA77DRAFT_116623 [Pyronema omphalodes]
MITAVVAAIAITQREARREKAAKEAEEAEARKKSILVIGAGIAGLFAALLCQAQGFPVTVVDKKTQGELLGQEEGIVWLAANALRVLEKVNESLIPELRKNAAQTETLHYRRYKSGKSIAKTPLGSDLLAFQKPDLEYVLLSFLTATVKFSTKILSYHDAPEDLDGPLPHGKPYALTASEEKLYADCIISTEELARTHVLASAGEELAEIDTRWSTITGSITIDSLPENPLLASDRTDVWVGDEAYVSTLTSDEEMVFNVYDLDALNEGQLPLEEIVEGWDPSLVKAVTHESITTVTKRLTIQQKPTSIASRKSRKILLFGDAAFTFPPHSPHLECSYHAEAAATLAVCLRKAASVPLGLEVYSRMRNPRYAKAMMIAQERFNTISRSSGEAELEASEIVWEIEKKDDEEGYWDYDADKFAEKNFDGVIDLLTQELLGKQKAMMEAAAKAQEEAERKAAENAKNGATEDGEDEEGEKKDSDMVKTDEDKADGSQREDGGIIS